MKYEREIGIQKSIVRRKPSKFPQKLEQMLKVIQIADEQSQKHENSICWSQDGTYIIIKNKDNLNDILPEYFKTDKLSSFNRQLNIFGFKHMKSDLNELIICNPYFTKDSNQLRNVKKYMPQSWISEHGKLQEDMSMILIQQQKLQQQVKLLMQIQAKIQQVQNIIFKVFLKAKVNGYNRRNLFCKSMLLMGKGFSDRVGFGTEVQRTQIDYIQFCHDDMEKQELDYFYDAFNNFSPLPSVQRKA